MAGTDLAMGSSPAGTSAGLSLFAAFWVILILGFLIHWLSMFQWEVGWADIAIGVLGVACARQALRGQWMTAVVAVLAIFFGGDAIGHVMQ